MRVLVLSTIYPNSKIFMSGIFVHEHVKALISVGIKAIVVSPTPFSPKILSFLSRKWKGIREIPEYENIDGVDVYHPRYIAIPRGILKAYWSYTYAFSVLRILKKIKIQNSIDIIHAHDSIPNDHGGYLIAKRLKKPLIITVHGGSVFQYTNKKSWLKKTRIGIQKSSAVIGVSTKVVRLIEEIYGRSENVFKILNGIRNEYMPKSNPFKNNAVNILFVGALYEEKGCKYLIKAFDLLKDKYPNIYLTIIGDGISAEEYKSLAKLLGMGNKVKFMGTLSNDVVLDYMAGCDIFIMPSWDEGFGMVYLEAMSFKKPVIGVKNEGIADIIEDGKNGFLIESKNVQSIVDILSLLIENDELRRKIGKNGFNSIKDQTWQKNAQETKKIYCEVLLERRF